MNDQGPRRPRMSDDFRRRPPERVTRVAPSPPVKEAPRVDEVPTPQPLPPQREKPPAKKLLTSGKARRSKLRWILGGAILLVVLILAAVYGWYRYELSPVSSDTTKTRITIESGMTPHAIADSLAEKHLVRSSRVFYTYLVLSQQRDNLQAGVYSLSPAQSSQTIVKTLVDGAVSDFSVTFYPGGTLTGTSATEKKYSITAQLEAAGYSDDAIQAALRDTYGQSELFAGKPPDSSLEGYIYGDTYNFAIDTPASAIVSRSLDEFAKVVHDNNLAALYKKQHLTLYQGITLASIVQREVNEPKQGTQPSNDQRQVAQVFYSRLSRHMTLGSDVTYIYGARQLGVEPSPSVKSPYNTRIHTGLPPGPIATPSLSALLAVAHPASTKYLYFLSGDNGKTYFSTTAKGHQANITNHCRQKCNL